MNNQSRPFLAELSCVAASTTSSSTGWSPCDRATARSTRPSARCWSRRRATCRTASAASTTAPSRPDAEVFRQLPATIHAAVVAAYLRGAFHARLDEAELTPYVDPWLGAAGQDAFYRQIAPADQRFTDEVEPLLGEIRAPVSLLWGAEDRWIPVATGARLADLVAGGKLTTIADAGHFLQEDAPQPVAEALRVFLRAG